MIFNVFLVFKTSRGCFSKNGQYFKFGRKPETLPKKKKKKSIKRESTYDIYNK